MEQDEILSKKFKDYMQEKKRKRSIKNYYTKKIKKGKSLEAVALDNIFIRIIIFVGIFSIIYKYMKKFWISFAISVMFFLVYLIIEYNIKKEKFEKNVDKINEQIVRNKYIKGISKCSSDDFIYFTKQVLEKYYNTKFILYRNGIHFVGNVDGNITGIKCIKKSNTNKVMYNDLIDYIEDMKCLSIDSGIIVTNTNFADNIFDKIDTDIDLVLIDFDMLMNIIEKVKAPYKTDDIEDFIISEINDEKKKILKAREKLFTKDKIYKYLLLSFLFYYMSNKVSFPIYYKAISIVCLILSIIAIWKNIRFYFRFKKE